MAARQLLQHQHTPTARSVGVASSSSLLCRNPSRLHTLHRRRMLSDTLANFSIPLSTGPYHRRPGVPARVAQFRPITGSGDPSHDSHDLELGQAPFPAQSGAIPPVHADAAATAAAAAAAAAPNGSSLHPELAAGEQLAAAVAAEVSRQRFEALYTESSSHRLVTQPDGSSRDLASPADDEQLPLLAEFAAHPIPAAAQQHHAAATAAAASSSTTEPPAAAASTSTSSSSSPAAAEASPAMIGGGIPRSIFVLSMVSMALTSASCVFNTLLPIYMVTELKMTMRTMGMFEGMLEAFSYVVRMFSGVISDKMTSRKAAITAGFAMGAAAKFGMSGATTTVSLFVTKAIDRLGNGVQAAPRDALIGDLSPAASRSACFGFAQSMRKWGSFMGAGLAFALMKASDNNYRAIFLLAAGVSALSTLAFIAFVPSHPTKNAAASSREAARSPAPDASQQQQQQDHAQPLQQQDKQAQQLLRLRQQQAPAQQQQHQAVAAAAKGEQTQQSQQQQQSQAQPQGLWENVLQFWRDVRSMGVDFYRTLSVIALYGLGHINESLLEARAIEVGFGKAESTLVVALLCFSVFLCAYPMGRLDDKYGHATTFALGMASLVAGDLVLLLSGSWPYAVFAACGFWGVHWAVVQGPMLSAVVGMAPPHLKGTAFGIFYTMMAVVAVIANTMFGSVWHAHSATAAFALSALLISITMVLTPFLLPASAKVGRKVPAAASAPAAAGGDAGAGGAAAGLKPATA